MSPLVTTADLAALGPLRLVYVPAADERPEGLFNVPIQDWIERAKGSRSGFDDLAFWRRELEALGVGRDATSVILDDGRMTEAARVWFILQYFGLPATVFNGGLAALATRPPQAPRSPGPLRLDPGAGKVGLRDRESLKDELTDVQIFDARTGAEFRGEDLKGNPRGGHLPGAANLSHHELLDGTRLRPAAEIARQLDAKRIDGSKLIVSHCNGGGRAALAALAAVVAGRPNVNVYYLSFAVSGFVDRDSEAKRRRSARLPRRHPRPPRARPLDQPHRRTAAVAMGRRAAYRRSLDASQCECR